MSRLDHLLTSISAAFFAFAVLLPMWILPDKYNLILSFLILIIGWFCFVRFFLPWMIRKQNNNQE